MRNQTKYIFIYLCVLCLLVGSVVRLAQAQETSTNDAQQNAESSELELSQAELEQILAPIALYPDTLLSHILVASTYPLEVVQAARWRAENEDLDEQQALDASEKKDWDPSVQALVPFNDLLQKLSADLDWLQTLGSAFLVNEEKLLASVQNLRQKAYEQGNLTDNEYVDIEKEEGEIVIETVRKEVVYVPYYDTRVVYGNWWWHHHQPYVWRRPVHAVYNAGFYWSIGFNIRPSFYFGGFHWHNRHLVINYNYRHYAGRHWRHNTYPQRVRVNEYKRWKHNPHHRKGAQYKVNGQRVHVNNTRVVVNNGGKKHHTHNKLRQTDKQRVINKSHYTQKKDVKRVKQELSRHNANGHKQTTRSNKIISQNKTTRNKQRDVSQHQSTKVAKTNYKSNGNTYKQKSSSKSNKVAKTNYKSNGNTYKQKSSSKSYRASASSSKQNKSRQVKTSRNTERR